MYWLDLKTLFINVGKQVAREAAEAAGVTWIVPVRTMPDRAAGKRDFNDIGCGAAPACAAYCPFG